MQNRLPKAPQLVVVRAQREAPGQDIDLVKQSPERVTYISLKRIGGLRFLRIGRLRVQWSWVRR